MFCSQCRVRDVKSTSRSRAFLPRVVHGLTTVSLLSITISDLLVHQYAVTGNNCSTAGAPFALINETAIPVPCPPSDAPGGCQAGDMAGQFGNLTASGSVMKSSYYDPYISLDPTQANYVGDLSFNVHFSNFTVIACCKYSPLLVRMRS